MLDVIVGASASGLFYLIVFGPMVLFENADITKQYDQAFTLELNGCFSILSLLIILIFVNLASSKYGFTLSFDRIVLFAKKALILNAMFWMVAIIVFYYHPAGASLLYLAGGVLGLFSTSSYVFGELNSGISGRKDMRTKQVLIYLGLVRIRAGHIPVNYSNLPVFY